MLNNFIDAQKEMTTLTVGIGLPIGMSYLDSVQLIWYILGCVALIVNLIIIIKKERRKNT
ncbi:MAG: hypothetical protein K9J13_13905 [Saprospiraceae bacterium]|nr:hypothetical protein [Saprospiraceae bacterium]